MDCVVLSMENREIYFPLDAEKESWLGGSSATCDIYLPFRGVSRRHFALKKKEREWWLEDLKSKNGTFIEGKKIKSTILQKDVPFQVGVLSLRLTQRKDVFPFQIRPVTPARKEEKTTDVLSYKDLQDEDLYDFPSLIFPPGKVLGKSPVMLPIYQMLERAVDSSLPVLLVGETGTGKEVFAQALHLSRRGKHKPFIAINCGAIPAELAEAELFGILPKTATGVGGRKGKFLQAQGGTVFLDEVSTLPLGLQAKLLRVLDEKKVTPVGSSTPISLDIDIISATNVPLETLKEKESFREDLSYRLAGLEIHLPPLRERKEDLELFVKSFLEEASQAMGKPIGGISQRLLLTLKMYSFPGNIRELKHLIESMVTLAYPGEILDVSHLPQKVLSSLREQQIHQALVSASSDNPLSLMDILDEVAKKLIRDALERCGGNITRAAELLGVSRRGLQKMIKRLGIH